VIAGYGAASCGSDDTGAHRHGDSRLGQSESALSVPNSLAYLDFDENSADGKTIALTFDDGPDNDGYTAKVLDVLKAKGVKSTFFVNIDNSIDVEASTAATNAIRRMVDEGHQVGNHSYHHRDFSSTSTNVDAELKGVDDLLHNVAPEALAARLVRAPFGNPFFGPQDRLDYVAPIMSHYGVHVGWNIDSLDWQCADDGKSSQCVRDNVLKAVDSGKSGIVLMHSINSLTPAILPTLIDDLRSRGMHFSDVESLVVAKYGKPSRALFACRADRDCIAGEHCGTNDRCTAGAGTTDAGTADSGTTDSDAATDGSTSGSVSVTCSSVTVTSGTVSNASTACSGTSPRLAKNDSTIVSWNTKADAYATYVSPYGASQIMDMQLTVAYRGDDKTEPLWYWAIRNVGTGAWDAVGDNSWAKNWSTTTHTFAIANPSRYVDASGRVQIRFYTKTSTNLAELNQMVLTVNGGAATDDAGATDTAPPDTADTAVEDTAVEDTAVEDTAVDSSTDSSVDSAPEDTGSADTGTTSVTDVVSCSSLTLVSGSLYGSVSTACSGTSPALATNGGTYVGFLGKTGTPKSSAYATYATKATPGTTSAMKLTVAYRGDDKTEPAWYWYAKNTTTGAWDLVGDNAWAGNWSTTVHTFVIADPARYVGADGKVQILFGTTSSTNDAELEQMLVEVTH
jgi:peptidoglycan/xylan/chitin deacetylase (PgdA/CDA1 family)